MKLKAVPVILIVALLVMSYSCSPVKTAITSVEGVDFSQYKTAEYLGWNEDSETQASQEDRERIEKAVGAEFRSRDFEILGEGADLEVSLFLVLNTETLSADYIAHHNGYYGIGSLGPSANMPEEDYDFVVGTLIIDVFDSESQKLVWQGIGTKTVTENPEKREKSTPKAIAKIMKEFPVKQVK